MIAERFDIRQLGDAALRAGCWLGHAADGIREAYVRAAEERRQREAAEEFAYDKALARFEAMFAEARAKYVAGIDFEAIGAEMDEEIARGPYAIADYVRPMQTAHSELVSNLVSQAGFPARDSKRTRKRLQPITYAAFGALNRDVFGKFDLYYLELNKVGALVFEDTWEDTLVFGDTWEDTLSSSVDDEEYIGVRTGYNYGCYRVGYV